MVAGIAVTMRRPRRAASGAGLPAATQGRRGWFGVLILTASAASCVVGSLPTAHAVTAESPEVLAIVDRGLRYLESNTDQQLGGKCLIGLAFHKRGMADTHPRIQAALDACRMELDAERSDSRIYSKAIALIFLAEVSPEKNRDLMAEYAKLVEEHQMGHGGFGYKLTSEILGDTSQTQYAALAYWEMLQSGMTPSVESIEKCVNWLLRTQSTDGGFVYKPVDPGSFELVEQTPRTSCMLSAGASSLLICGNMLGLMAPKGLTPVIDAPPGVKDSVPEALRRADVAKQRIVPKLKGTGALDLKRMQTATQNARKWWEEKFDVANGGYYPQYALYALERYKSFEEYISGQAVAEPDWYNRGYDYLKKTQQADGSWAPSGEASAPCSTAFAVLFLLRSTQASIQARLGEGTLVGGRGLPADLSKVRLRGGRLVVDQDATGTNRLIELLEEYDAEHSDELTEEAATLASQEVSSEQAARLTQIARTGKPEQRLLAVKMLGRMREVDNAPALIFALTDPDRRVVRAARDGLLSISREFDGYGPPDNFDEAQRKSAIDDWKAWFQRVRPGAAPLR